MPGRYRTSIAALFLAVACGAAPGPGGVSPSPPTAALAAWQNFPPDQVPRSVVLLGIEQRGQAFDPGVGKIAGVCARFALSTELPIEAPAESRASWADGTKVTYAAALSAREALTSLSANPTRATMPECATIQPLRVTAIRFDVATFPTDRGRAQMSAWLFTVTGARADFAYPAIPTSALWGGGITTARSGNGATVSTDGRSLTYSFTGAQEGTGPCQEIYKGVVAESSTAVAVATSTIPHERLNDGLVACTLIGYQRSVPVALATALGGRVVVDSRGAVVPVCPEAMRSVC